MYIVSDYLLELTLQLLRSFYPLTLKIIISQVYKSMLDYNQLPSVHAYKPQQSFPLFWLLLDYMYRFYDLEGTICHL